MNPQEALKKFKRIAVIGFSDNPNRESNIIGKYMSECGYIVYGINPKLGGKSIGKIACFSSLSELPEKVEIVNVFRNPEYLEVLIDEVLKLDYKPLVWTQLGVVNEKAKNKAIEHGLDYIENKCIFIEQKRIF